MPDPTPPSPRMLWLEEALTGWILPVLALAAAGAGVALYVSGLLPEAAAAGLVIGTVTVAGGLLAARGALSRPDRLGRGLGLAAAVAAVLVAGPPAVSAVLPGRPVAEGDLAAVGDSVQVPEAGRVRFLVQARLPREGTPQVDFRLAGAGGALAGHLERTVSYARVGRGSRAAVTHDHTSTWLHGALPAGGGPVSLEKLRGEVAGPLHLAAYADGLPGWALYALAALTLAVAGAAEARLGGGSTAPAAGMTVAFGLIVVGYATPGAAVGTALVALMLGGMGGAIAGGLFAWVARRVVPVAPPPTSGQPARKAGGRGGKGGGPAKAA